MTTRVSTSWTVTTVGTEEGEAPAALTRTDASAPCAFGVAIASDTLVIVLVLRIVVNLPEALSWAAICFATAARKAAKCRNVSSRRAPRPSDSHTSSELLRN